MREYPNEGKVRVGSFGERLRREREMRGVSLDDIAGATKIGTRLLRALEEEHFELLPGGIFNKGFVRAYAKYLGLSEEEAVADYLEAAGETIPDPRVIAEQNSPRVGRYGGDGGSSRPAGFPIIPVLILLLVIAAGAGGWQIYQQRVRDREAKAQANPSSAAGPVTGVATPEATKSTTATTPSTPPDSDATRTANPGGVAISPTGVSQAGTTAATSANLNAPTKNGTQSFEVTVRASDNAWVSIKSDGKFVVRGILGPSDVKTIHASDQVVFWTGNAGAVEVAFNGQPVPLTGGLNQKAMLVFDSHGVVSPNPAQ